MAFWREVEAHPLKTVLAVVFSDRLHNNLLQLTRSNLDRAEFLTMSERPEPNRPEGHGHALILIRS
jgi:hypothetical protein